jgi:hypothetical protein
MLINKKLFYDNGLFSENFTKKLDFDTILYMAL